MPRVPNLSKNALGVRASTFVAFQKKLLARAAAGDLIPLHLGDTVQLPPEPSRRIDPDVQEIHRYGPVAGDTELRAAVARDLARLGASVETDEVTITPGATGALNISLDAALEPGDEVIVLTPSWPLIFGLLQARGFVPVEVDVDPSGWLPDPETLRARIEAAIGERTAGIYFCDPNNPVGFVYSREHLDAIGALARAHGLWLFYDAVYIDLHLAPPEAPPLSFLDEELRAQTFLLFSYSKAFGLAGHRVGAALAPPRALPLMPRLMTHSTYHCSRWAQRMALRCLTLEPEDLTAERASRVAAAAEGAAAVQELLGGKLRFHAPQAGTFAFLDLRGVAASDAEAMDRIERCLDAGVSLAPGSAFGERFGRFARLCFTATTLEELREGCARIAPILA